MSIISEAIFRSALVLFLFTFGLSSPLIAQKFFQMEKIGSLKVKKYYVGDQLTFQIKEYPNVWLTESIEDIYQEENMILFSDRAVKLDEIVKIRRKKKWSKGIGNNLYRFGIAWAGFSLLGTLGGVPLTWAAAIVPASSFVAGFLIKNLFKHRTYRIGKKRRLRILDLDRKIFFQGP